jgi:hypothetical protein
MALITVSARLASTRPVDKYPGWTLAPEALHRLAERLAAGDIPMLFDHDAHQPIAARYIDANVVPLEDGNFALEADFEVDADAWQAVQSTFDEAGVAGGFSFTATADQSPSQWGEEAAITIAADASAWTDAERDEARALLDAVVPTRSARLFQYSGIELATVFLVLGPVALGVLGNAAYDAIKYLVGRRSSQTRVEIHRQGSDGTVTKAIVTTSDPDVAQAALESLPRDQSPPVVSFDTKKRLWLDHTDP